MDRNAEHVGENGLLPAVFSGGVKSSDFKNLFWCQVMLFTTLHGFYSGGKTIAIGVTRFIHLVRHVVCLCSGKKMVRVHARRIVAMVANAHTLWYRPFLDVVRKAVRLGLFSFDVDGSIAFNKPASRPDPTRSEFWSVLWDWAIFINTLPKALLYRFESFSIRIHGSKTPGRFKVKSAEKRGNESTEGKFGVLSFFAATSRPRKVYTFPAKRSSFGSLGWCGRRSGFQPPATFPAS